MAKQGNRFEVTFVQKGGLTVMLDADGKPVVSKV